MADNKTCYNPDHSVNTVDKPCNGAQEGDSVLCSPGWACLNDKVCQWTPEAGAEPKTTDFLRGSCTAQSWKSDACPQFCDEYDNTTGRNPYGNGSLKEN